MFMPTQLAKTELDCGFVGQYFAFIKHQNPFLAKQTHPVIVSKGYISYNYYHFSHKFNQLIMNSGCCEILKECGSQSVQRGQTS